MGSLHDTEVAGHSRWISKQDFSDELRRGVFRSLELKELKEILAHLHVLGLFVWAPHGMPSHSFRSMATTRRKRRT